MEHQTFEYSHLKPEIDTPGKKEIDQYFDKSDARKRVFQKLQHDYLKIGTVDELKNIPKDWTVYSIDGGKITAADPKKIILNYAPSEDTSYEKIGWKKIGTMYDGYSKVLAAPCETELDFQRIPGVEIHQTADDVWFQISTLTVDILPHITDDVVERDTTAEINIARSQVPGNKANLTKEHFHTTNPDIASTSLVSELKLMLQQLKSMGYTKISAVPSDERRNRVYQRMGMKPAQNDEESLVLIARIDDLLKPRQHKQKN